MSTCHCKDVNEDNDVRGISQYSGRIVSVLRKGSIVKSLILFQFVVSKIQQVLARVACTNGFLASLYFTFVSTKFYREHKGVLQGIQAYKRADVRGQQTSSQLRRNIHRLEKGLIMRPRRETFAEDYIEETVKLLKHAFDGGTLCADEIKWAKDVLLLYFSVVSDTPKIKATRNMFMSLEVVEDVAYIPYQRDAVPDLKISYDQLLTLFKRRRSVRWYLNRMVEKELIYKAVEAASLAPSACNRQPFTFHVLCNKERAVKVARMAGGTVGFAENIPCLIVVVGDLNYYFDERDRHLIYIDGSLASMQLMLALETLGLSSCPINWPDIEQRERAIQHELDLEKFQRPVMQISVGYPDPDGGIPFSQKKSAELLIHQPD
jgi:nitroreductase